jgi:Tetratricopeptide repeat
VLRRAGPDSADRAEALLERSLDIARQRYRLAPGACRAAVSLGRLRLAQGRRDAARQLLEAALAAFTESFATAELKAAKALLSEL